MTRTGGGAVLPRLLSSPSMGREKDSKEDTSMFPAFSPVKSVAPAAHKLSRSIHKENTFQFPACRRSIFLFLLVIGCGVFSVDAQTYGGQATAVKVTVAVPLAPVVTNAVSDTGPLPAAGGTVNLASAGATVAGVVTVGTSTVSASGVAGDSQATASVNNLNINLLGNTISADVISANTDCACPNATSTGTFSITNLVINGASVTVDGTANQTIALPGAVGNVVLNERLIFPRSIAVNAIHIFVRAADLTTTDVIIASASSTIDCAIVPAQNLFSGRGTALRLTQGVTFPGTLLTAVVSDTGDLPTSGASIATATNNAGVSPIVSSGTATSSTSGGVTPSTINSSQSASQVQTLNVNLLSSTVVITADALTSNTNCVLSGGVVTCGGTSVITNLNVLVNGLAFPIVISGAPNQTVVIPVPLLGSITLVINEQESSDAANITVTALHLTTNLTGLTATDLRVARSHSDMVRGIGPTPVDAAISGRISDENGIGVPNAFISATNTNGIVRSGRSNAFGNYAISGLTVGRAYVISVTHKGYTFPPRVLTLLDDTIDFNFAPTDSGKQ
ncbi:MAG: carboxypeptidase-like regulatory domain-containing protein [Acidobacteriota bacterium]